MVEPEGVENQPASDSRRRFLLLMAAGTFAAPVVASFTLDALSSGAATRHAFPNQSAPNQQPPVQRLPNQPSQSFPNQIRT